MWWQTKTARDLFYKIHPICLGSAEQESNQLLEIIFPAPPLSPTLFIFSCQPYMASMSKHHFTVIVYFQNVFYYPDLILQTPEGLSSLLLQQWSRRVCGVAGRCPAAEPAPIPQCPCPFRLWGWKPAKPNRRGGEHLEDILTYKSFQNVGGKHG